MTLWQGVPKTAGSESLPLRFHFGFLPVSRRKCNNCINLRRGPSAASELLVHKLCTGRRAMSPRKPRPSPRFRVGKVSVYEHHGAWWIYYRDGTGPHRKKVASTRDEAERVAARVNSQLASSEPTLLTFTPISPAELRRQFLDYHEHVLHSAVGTLNRYRSATQHLEDFVATLPKVPAAHELPVQHFAAYLRRIEVAPNGHANTAKRKLRGKGIQYVLQTCRAMYNYAVKRRHLPPYLSVRTPEGVRKVYYGRRTAANLMAGVIESRKEARRAAKRANATGPVDEPGCEAERLVVDLNKWAKALSTVWLVLTGHHCYHGCWRRKNVAKKKKGPKEGSRA